MCIPKWLGLEATEGHGLKPDIIKLLAEMLKAWLSGSSGRDAGPRVVIPAFSSSVTVLPSAHLRGLLSEKGFQPGMRQ